ncbi:hypothetical protein [Aureispira anguillae]|uniref:Uncharacterized protein n=1 Tax=Aureispira anguillae TaxID=2864201 RepID=A0A916DRS1_9BACT|nr:hypothetical protein [Aureispira anguillae]BDS10587.1 hypothetical protein AsAng_0012950 [Aureispira anguillae]
MYSKLIKLKKGAVITLDGSPLQLSKAVNLRVVATNKSDSKPAPTKVAQGEHQQDLPHPVDKKEVLALVQEHLNKLGQDEYALMMDGIFQDDDLEALNGSFNDLHKTSIYAATVTHISELKSLYQALKNL